MRVLKWLWDVVCMVGKVIMTLLMAGTNLQGHNACKMDKQDYLTKHEEK